MSPACRTARGDAFSRTGPCTRGNSRKVGLLDKGAMNQLWVRSWKATFAKACSRAKGIIKTITGETYTGDFVDGEYHGLGTYTNEKEEKRIKGPGDGASGQAEARRPSRTARSTMATFFG